MPRKIKTKKRITDAKSIIIKQPFIKGAKVKQDFRFNISLIFLIAMLSVSAYLLLFSLTQNGKADLGFEKATVLESETKKVNSLKTVAMKKNQLIDDSSLDFKLEVPSRLGQWIYRIGYVKGLTDDSLVNQFLKIYIVQQSTANSTSFDNRFKDFLTIRKFSVEEWKELEKGCDKGNLFFCEGAGTKINEKDGLVWAYTKAESCSSNEMKAICANIEGIIESFQFK